MWPSRACSRIMTPLAPSMRDRLRGARLLERMRACKGVLCKTGANDTRHRRVRLEVDVEQLGSDRVAHQADVRSRHCVTVAVAPGLRIATEMGLERRERLRDPVPDPLEALRLVELELVFEKVAHPRHDQGMGVAGDDEG